MFCGNCGHSISESLKYCPYCGKPISREKKSVEKDNDHIANAEVQKSRMIAAPKAPRISRRTFAVCSVFCALGVFAFFLVYQILAASSNQAVKETRSFSGDFLVSLSPDSTKDLSEAAPSKSSNEVGSVSSSSDEMESQDPAVETPVNEKPPKTSEPEQTMKSVDLSVQPEMWIEEVDAPRFITQSEHGLILRAGPGTNYDWLPGKLTIPFATEIFGIGFTNGIDNWFVTAYNGKVGWVSASYTRQTGGDLPVPIQDSQSELVEPDEWIDVSEQPHYITQSEHGLIMRKGPGTDYDRVEGETTIPYNTEIVCVGYDRGNDEWFVTEYKGQFGWVSSSYVIQTIVRPMWLN